MTELKDLNKYDKLLICNGCGPDGFKGKFKGVDFIFKDDCNQHDVDYWSGGHEEQRKEADERFYANMKKRIKEGDYGVFKRFIYYFMARNYYKLVRKLGNRFFEYRSRRVGEKEVPMILNAKDLPSYSSQIDYRFTGSGIYNKTKYRSLNGRWELI